jgi:hypothetical protein
MITVSSLGSFGDAESGLIVGDYSWDVEDASSLDHLQRGVVVAGSEVVVDQELDHRHRDVGLRVGRGEPHLLKDLLDGLVGLGDLVVAAVQH